MLRQSSSRNQRSKGFKVKHALQICVLLAVCVWLMYQVKHSHDKNKALEQKSTKISTAVVESSLESLRLGRKDLPETKTENETHIDDEGNEEVEEETESEPEREAKPEENEEDESRGASEDEIDENDQEEADEETEHERESEDEDEKEDQLAELQLLTNHDQDSASENSQVAREENYKGDDASSAVVRDTENTESETVSLGGGSIHDDLTENVERDLVVGNKTVGTVDNSKVDEFDIFSEKRETLLSDNVSTNEQERGSLFNSTSVQSISQIDQQSNLTVETPSVTLVETHNNSSVVVDSKGGGLSVQNLTLGVNLAKEQSSVAEIQMNVEGENPNSTVHDNFNSEKILIEQSVKSNLTNGGVGLEENTIISSNSSESDTTTVSGNAVQDESNDSLTNEHAVTGEERDARTDLSSLAITQTETKFEGIAGE